MHSISGIAQSFVRCLPSKEKFLKGVIVSFAITSVALGALSAIKPLVINEAGRFFAFKAVNLGAISIGASISSLAAFILAHPFVVIAVGVGTLALLIFAKMALEIKNLKVTIARLDRKGPLPLLPKKGLIAPPLGRPRPLPPNPPGPSPLLLLKEQIAKLTAGLKEAGGKLEKAEEENKKLIEINRAIVEANEKNLKEIEALRLELEALKGASHHHGLVAGSAASSVLPPPPPPPPPPLFSPLVGDGSHPSIIKNSRAVHLAAIASRPPLRKGHRKMGEEDWQRWLKKYDKSWIKMDQVIEALKFVKQKINVAELDLLDQNRIHKDKDVSMSYASPHHEGAATRVDKEKIQSHLNRYKKVEEKLHEEALKLADNHIDRIKYEMFKRLIAQGNDVLVSDDESDDEEWD